MTAPSPRAQGQQLLQRVRSLVPGPPLTRFAPAPTGWLHLGHAVNAVWVWGIARALGGRVLLRVEEQTKRKVNNDVGIWIERMNTMTLGAPTTLEGGVAPPGTYPPQAAVRLPTRESMRVDRSDRDILPDPHSDRPTGTSTSGGGGTPSGPPIIP